MRRTGLARTRRPLSPKRQPDGPVRTFGLNAGPTALVPPQPPGWSHLVSTGSGALTLRTSDAVTLITRDAAAWVPNGVRYAVELHGRCEVRIAYVAEASEIAHPFGVYRMNAIMREIVERALHCGFLDPNVPRHARLLAVFRDEINALSPASSHHELALPHDADLRKAVEYALREIEQPPAVTDLAQIAGMSVRTFERRFAAESGLTPRAWLRRMRLGVAMTALASGASCTDAGLASGYASLSAFTAAYRDVFGMAPSRNSQQS